MARTYQIVDGQLEITETRPDRVRTMSALQLNRRINRLTDENTEIDNRIAALQAEKTANEAIIAELTPYLGQI